MDLPVCAVAQASIHRQMIGLTDVRLRSDMDGVDATLAIHCILEAKIGFITGSSDPATMARIQLDHPLAVLR